MDINAMVKQLIVKVDELLTNQQGIVTKMAEIDIHLKYGRDRFDKQCDAIHALESRCDKLEQQENFRKGHIQVIYAVIALVTAAGAAAIFIFR